VHHLVLLSLIVFVAAVVTGLALAGYQGLGAWRAFRGFRRTAGAAMVETAGRIERLEARTAGLAGRTERVEQARARLEASLAEAAVIGEAADEVGQLVSRLGAIVPHK